MSGRDGVLLLMGSGLERYRGYLVASAARRERMWLFDPQEPNWQRRYVEGADVVDVFDPDAAVAAARALARKVPVRGVLCYHEGVILTAACVAQALGVPSPTVAAVRNCRDKALTRRRLTEAGVAQPRFALVAGVEEALTAARRIGYPLVVKPRSLGASQGVVRVDRESDLATALENSRSATQAGMPQQPTLLLEEYLRGPEISLDAAVYGGEYLPMFLARKRVGPEPFFEETGHVVASDDPLLADRELTDMLAAAHAALGFGHGITHTEVKLTERGPVVVEINGRLGGDLIPYLGWLATGVDPADVAVDLALGTRPNVRARRPGSAGIRFLYPPRSAVFRRAILPPPGDMPGLRESLVLADAGSVLRLPPDGYAQRYACLLATAEAAADCTLRLDAAEARARAEWEPVDAGLAAGAVR